MAHQMPHAPMPRGGSGATLCPPSAWWPTLTGRQSTKTPVTLMPPNPHAPSLAPCALASDVGASLHPDAARAAQLPEAETQAYGSKTAIGRDDDAACAHGPGPTPPRPAAACPCGALHPSLEPRGVIGAPVNGDSPMAHHAGAPQPRLVRCNRPGNGQAHCAVRGALRQSVAQHSLSQPSRLKPLRMAQTGEAFARGFLMATIACQLGLPGCWWLNDRRDEVAEGFALMAVCPGPEKRDRIAQTRRGSVWRCHTHKLSQGPSPWRLVISENVSRHQRAHPERRIGRSVQALGP